MSSWSIRPAAVSDIDAVLALWRDGGGPESPTPGKEPLKRLLEHDGEALLLAEADDQSIGALIAAWDGWRGSFYRLAVAPGWRRQGVATGLIRAGKERLQALGARRLTAIVIGDDDVATGFWAAAGYERQANRARFVRMPEQPC